MQLQMNKNIANTTTYSYEKMPVYMINQASIHIVLKVFMLFVI